MIRIIGYFGQRIIKYANCLIERNLGLDLGHEWDIGIVMVQRIEHLLSIAEYKRRQSAPGVKVTRRNFGRDRRYPIVNPSSTYAMSKRAAEELALTLGRRYGIPTVNYGTISARETTSEP